MTIHRYLNQTGWGTNYTMWFTIQALKAAGWTVKSSGSGTGGIYEPAGDVFDPVDNPKANTAAVNIGIGSGSEHFGNEGCWLVIEDPGGNRQICFRRHKSAGDPLDAYWWMGFSEAAGFVGGTPDVDDPPDATDERLLSTSGTKAVPGSTGKSGSSPIVCQIAADDTPSPAGEYGFIALELVAPNNLSMSIGLDDIRDVAAGDPAPWTVFHRDLNLAAATLYGASSQIRALFDKGGAGESYAYARYAAFYMTDSYSNRGGVSLYDAKERPMPIPVIGYAIGGYIGMSRWFRQPGVERDYPQTGDGETLLYIDGVIIVDLLDGLTTPISV